jgi:hypothetical protein
MRDLFTLLSRYNAHANTEMFGILLTAPPELVAEPGGSHYDSILGLLNHILVSDLGWLNAYRESDLTFDTLDSRALDFERPSAGARQARSRFAGDSAKRYLCSAKSCSTCSIIKRTIAAPSLRSWTGTGLRMTSRTSSGS